MPEKIATVCLRYLVNTCRVIAADERVRVVWNRVDSNEISGGMLTWPVVISVSVLCSCANPHKQSLRPFDVE